MTKENMKGGENEMNEQAPLMIEVEHHHCLKCGHVWQPRKGRTDYPRICPKCKSLRWDKQDNIQKKQ